MRCETCHTEHPTHEPCDTLIPVIMPPHAGGAIFDGPGAQRMEPADPLAGLTVGSYRILRPIGRGGTGIVYLGENVIVGSVVAVKVLHEHLVSDARQLARFEAEARAAGRIGHENIAAVLDSGALPSGRPFLVMEYLEGQALSALAGTIVSPLALVAIVGQICDALGAAHDAGVVHRDLKPDNIILIKTGAGPGQVKLFDFGSARLFLKESPASQTPYGALVGTPQYMAPEVTASEDVDGRADLYSLGVLAYQLATGQLPFTAKALADLLIAHRQQTPRPAFEVNPALSRELSAVIMRALAKDPAARFPTARAMRDALLAAREGASFRPPVAGAQALSAAFVPPAIAPLVGPGAAPLPAGTPAGPQARLHPRHATTFPCRFSNEGGADRAVEAQVTDLSRGGAFIRTSAPPPPVFSRVRLRLDASGGRIDLQADVVRHVKPEEATAWGMEVGFGVQFIAPTPDQREAIAQAMVGLPLKAAPVAPPTGEDDPFATELLSSLAGRLGGDPYTLLAAMPDADFAVVRKSARNFTVALESLKSFPLSERQRLQTDTALQKVADALQALGTPERRAEYDSSRGNFRGVARCLAAGLSVTELDLIRRRFVARNETAVGRAHIHFRSGAAWESQRAFKAAAQEYEKALTLDPLNLELHKRYWALQGK